MLSASADRCFPPLCIARPMRISCSGDGRAWAGRSSRGIPGLPIGVATLLLLSEDCASRPARLRKPGKSSLPGQKPCRKACCPTVFPMAGPRRNTIRWMHRSGSSSPRTSSWKSGKLSPGNSRPPTCGCYKRRSKRSSATMRREPVMGFTWTLTGCWLQASRGSRSRGWTPGWMDRLSLPGSANPLRCKPCG